MMIIRCQCLLKICWVSVSHMSAAKAAPNQTNKRSSCTAPQVFCGYSGYMASRGTSLFLPRTDSEVWLQWRKCTCTHVHTYTHSRTLLMRSLMGSSLFMEWKQLAATCSVSMGPPKSKTGWFYYAQMQCHLYLEHCPPTLPVSRELQSENSGSGERLSISNPGVTSYYICALDCCSLTGSWYHCYSNYHYCCAGLIMIGLSTDILNNTFLICIFGTLIILSHIHKITLCFASGQKHHHLHQSAEMTIVSR